MTPRDTATADPVAGLVLAAGHYLSSGAMPAEGSFHLRQLEADFQRVQTPIARTVLDHVAAGNGRAGNLTVGAVAGDPHGSGIGRFEITVERDSTLATIGSTGDALREVVVRSGLDRGRFTAWGSDGVLGHPDCAVGGEGWAPEHFGFNDVRLIDLSALRAASRIDVRINHAAAAKYAADPALADGLVYRGGSADDAISLFIDGRLVGCDVFKLGLHGGAGNDRLELVFTEHDTGAGAGRITVVPGPGDDVVLLPPRAASVRIVFGPDFGDDEIRFFGLADQLDLRALAGDHLVGALRALPQAGELTVQPGAIVLARGGAATLDAAGVAARFADPGTQTQAQQQVYLSVDPTQQAQVWHIDDPMGAGNVSATLVGSITLPFTSWAELTADNFG